MAYKYYNPNQYGDTGDCVDMIRMDIRVLIIKKQC